MGIAGKFSKSFSYFALGGIVSGNNFALRRVCARIGFILALQMFLYVATAYTSENKKDDQDDSSDLGQNIIWLPSVTFPPADPTKESGYLPLLDRDIRFKFLYYKIMLRCGLRVEEVANLKLADLDLRRNRLIVRNGKGCKDRVVYISKDAYRSVVDYLKVELLPKTKSLPCRERTLLRKSRLGSCHTEKDRILCRNIGHQSVLSSLAPYYGNPVIKR